MEEKKEVSRKQFLKAAGSTALFATLGIAFNGCGSTTDAGDDGGRITPPAGNGNGNGGSSGITITNNGNTITIDLSEGSLSNLRQQGSWLLIGDADTLVVNVSGDVIRAFTAVCPHASCTDSWQFSNGLFECAQSGCGHGSRFDTNGEVVNGPASRDLDEFNVSRDDDIVTINK